MRIEIELGLDDVVATKGWGDSVEDVTLREAILDAISKDVIKEYVTDEDRQRIRSRVTQIADLQIKEAVEPLISAAIETVIVPGLGRKETTLQEHIVAIVKEELKGRGDRYGDRFGSRGDGPLLARIIKSEVEHALTTELRQDIDEAKKEARAAVREKAADVIAETITRMSAHG